MSWSDCWRSFGGILLKFWGTPRGYASVAYTKADTEKFRAWDLRMKFRAFSAVVLGATLTLAPSCGLGTAGTAGAAGTAGDAAQNQGRLTARPAARTTWPAVAAGSHRLGLADERDGIVYVPTGTWPARLPLIVLLHGAGSGSQRQLERFQAAL